MSQSIVRTALHNKSLGLELDYRQLSLTLPDEANRKPMTDIVASFQRGDQLADELLRLLMTI